MTSLKDIKVGDVFYGHFSHTKLKVLALPTGYCCAYLVYDYDHDWEDTRTPEHMLWELGYDPE